MATEDRRVNYWEALRLAAEGAPIEEFIEVAAKAQGEIADEYYRLWQETAILDNLVARIAPEAAWVSGVPSTGRDAFGRLVVRTPPMEPIQKALLPTQAVLPTQALLRTRTARIMEIAQELIANGAVTVWSAQIAKILRREGVEGLPRDLAVSAGNVLARTDGWEKVQPGEYAPVR